MPKASSTFSIKTAKAILTALKPATEAAMGGLLTDVHPIACGFEGCAFSAEHPKLGHVVLKVGRLRQDKMERYDPMLDYEAAAKILRARIPGVATVHGLVTSVGTKRNAGYVLVKERVSTDWAAYTAATGVTAAQLAKGDDILSNAGVESADACNDGDPWPRVHKNHQAVLDRTGLAGVLRGVKKLKSFGICAGEDVKIENLGWRAGPSGKPEVVIIDLGYTQQLDDGLRAF